VEDGSNRSTSCSTGPQLGHWLVMPADHELNIIRKKNPSEDGESTSFWEEILLFHRVNLGRNINIYKSIQEDVC